MLESQPKIVSVKKLSNKRKIIVWSIGIFVTLILSTIISGLIWYQAQLSPVGTDISQLEKITIVKGSTPDQIAKQLKSQSVIQNSTVFRVYLRLSGNNNKLQAGTYRLSPAETVPQIVDHLINGSVDQFSITFYPGATLKDTTDNKKKYDVTTILKNVGYTDQEIETALSKTYVSPLFIDKPANADLEGYVYGQTYNFNIGATVEDILQKTFDEFYSVVQKNNLIEKFKNHGLNLYQGITLASIVQREINSPQGQNQPTLDQTQAAQVFYSRLEMGMALGSDVTYQYIADKMGVVRDVYLDSPYNTRLYVGLPPGPIASPGLLALLAVSEPAKSNYLYFLSGDDNITYFATTNAEHEANKTNYCKIKCAPGIY